MLRSNRPILVGLFETAPCRKPTLYGAETVAGSLPVLCEGPI